MNKANWSPDEAVQLARELNNFGTHYRNAVASLYNTFSNVLGNYWRGKNYNIVAEYVNEHYNDFDSITNNICIKIPAAIQDIAARQAEDGRGTINFSYDIYDPSGLDSAIAFNLIPMTDESPDGNVALTQDTVEKYIDGTSEPSLIYYQEKMDDYMNSYISTLEQFRGISEFNEALKVAFEACENYKTFSTNAVKEIIEETKLRADTELGKISEADASTKDLAVTALTNGPSGNSTSTTNGFIKSSVGPNSASSFSSTSVSSNSSNTVTYNQPVNTKTSSDANTNETTSNITYDKPIGPDIPSDVADSKHQQNIQVIDNYLNSDYEKGATDDHVYTINGQEMYIDEIKDNGDSYTITYYDKEEFDNDSFTESSTMEIDK